MAPLLALVRKELTSLFAVPTAYLALTMVALVTALIFFDHLRIYNQVLFLYATTTMGGFNTDEIPDYINLWDTVFFPVMETLGLTLIGAGRAVEMLTNAVLPFFAAGMEPRPGRMLQLFRALPRPAAYGAIRHLDEAVGGAVRVDARRQQGMLFLLRSYCSQGRCGSCPLS